MNKEKTVLQELFMQLKMQLGNNKVSQMFDEVYWLAKEQEQIEKAFSEGYQEAVREECGHGSRYKDANGVDYYKTKYGGEDVDR